MIRALAVVATVLFVPPVAAQSVNSGLLANSLLQTQTNPLKSQADVEMKSALKRGLHIVSVGTPELSGVYLLDSTNQMDPTTMVLYIKIFDAFPGGLRQFPWPDRDGKIHLLPNTQTALAFFRALSDYTAQLDIAYNTALAGGKPTWPSQAVNIP